MTQPGPIHLVFVHGLFSKPKVWDRFRELIASDPELNGFILAEPFKYPSPKLVLRLDRRIADIDDLADLLGTYLGTHFGQGEQVVLISHSLGGLIVQRYLARTVNRARGAELVRIRRIVFFACPNEGSKFLLGFRKNAIWQHPQERELRPLSRQILDARDTVLRAVLYADGRSAIECRIPITAVCGISDGIVPPYTAAGIWPDPKAVDADHFSIVQPESRSAMTYQVLKAELRAAARPDNDALADPPDGQSERGPADQPGLVSVEPPPAMRSTALRGRDDLVADLMREDQPGQVHVLAGPGGSGKSRLAFEVALQWQRAGRTVWWVPVNRINSCMREIANQVGAPDGQVERAWRGEGSATDLIWRMLNNRAEPWLLIFDNADAPAVLGMQLDQAISGTGWLRPPASPAGMVIVTSRDRNTVTWESWSKVHLVPPLSVEAGAAMLIDQVQTGSQAMESLEQAKLLSEELGGLPLALRAAANHIKTARTSRVWSGTSGLRTFEGYRAAIKKRFESPPSDRGHSMELADMRQVYDLSLTLLDRPTLPQAAPLLKLLACLGIGPIPYYALLNADLLAESPLFARFTDRQRTRVLDRLADLGLIELPQPTYTSEDSGTDISTDLAHVLWLHPVVHGILREDPEVQRQRSDYYGLNARLILRAVHGADPDYPENWAIWRSLAPHAIEVAKAALLGRPPLADREAVVSVISMARLVSRYLIATGLIVPAQDLIHQLVDACASFGCGADGPEILGLRHEKARIALERGDQAAAEAQLRDVILARTGVLGENHPDTLASRHKLARAVLEQSRWAEAEILLRSVVQAEYLVRGPEHPDTVVVRHSLARAILAQRRFAEAEAMTRQILEIRLRRWSPTTPETLFTQQTLARCLLEQQKFADAEPVLEAVLAQASAQPDVPVVLSLRFTLCQFLLAQGRIREAVSRLTALQADRARVLGPTHPDTVQTAELLGRASEILGGLEEEGPA